MIILRDEVKFEQLKKYGFECDKGNVEKGDYYYSSNNYFYECSSNNFRICINMLNRNIEILCLADEPVLHNTYQNDLDVLYRLIKDGLVVIKMSNSEINIFKRKDGLTKEEGEIMDSLVCAWNSFIELERQHPNEVDYFGDGIHMCQHMLMNRILRRDYPEGYPIKVCKN